MSNAFVSIEQAIADIHAGKMVVLVDDKNRENEGDLCIAADKITPEAINFMAKHGRGLICLALAGDIVDRLQLPMMVKDNQTKYGTAFTVAIEAANGVTTGISAADRAHTIQAAIHPQAKPSDLISPGHIFPLRAKDGGVLVRPGQTEGSVDLAKLAGLTGGAVICEIINDDGTMARLSDLEQFSTQHQISLVHINDLIIYQSKNNPLVKEIASSRLPTEQHGDFTIKVFGNPLDTYEHVVLVKDDIQTKQSTLVRLHSECFTGDILGSARCDCGWQLNAAMAKIAKQGGILIYLRGQEGRGIGLANKIKAYQLQDEQGLDTVEANHDLGFAADQRDYNIAAQILRYLDVQHVRLLTNNPTKINSLTVCGLHVVAREPLEMPPTEENNFYLQTKRTKLGHLFRGIEEVA